MDNTFTDQDLQNAINEGIFNASNDVTAPPAKVIRFFERWAKERAVKLRHEAAKIAIESKNPDDAHRLIMNLNF